VLGEFHTGGSAEIAVVEKPWAGEFTNLFVESQGQTTQESRIRSGVVSPQVDLVVALEMTLELSMQRGLTEWI